MLPGNLEIFLHIIIAERFPVDPIDKLDDAEYSFFGLKGYSDNRLGFKTGHLIESL